MSWSFDATYFTATSQVAGCSCPLAPRTRGEVSRSGWSSVAAADQPFTQSPPSLTGNFALPATTTPPVFSTAPAGRGATCIPHCSAQYGQWVATLDETAVEVRDIDNRQQQ